MTCVCRCVRVKKKTYPSLPVLQQKPECPVNACHEGVLGVAAPITSKHFLVFLSNTVQSTFFSALFVVVPPSLLRWRVKPAVPIASLTHAVPGSHGDTL